MIITPSYSFTRPANTTQYSANDLVANNATAGSVVPMSFYVGKGGLASGRIKRVRLFKDVETTTAASFKVHLFSASPTVTNGDNGALAVATGSTYLGAVAVDMSSGAFATTTDLFHAAVANPEIAFDALTTIYGLLEAIGAYAPGSGEGFTVTLEVEK